jgi:hypothetical protein
MTWDSGGFTQLRSVSGTLSVDMMGQVMEIPYTADLFTDGAQSVGAVSAQGPQGTTWLFVSVTEPGAVYTQSAPRDGDLDIDGERLVTTTARDRDGILAAHLAAVGDGARVDPAALDAALQAAPQTAVRLAAEAMKKLAAGFAAGLS